MDTVEILDHAPMLLHDLPEAPCSVNAFLDLPKVGRTQITGRGYIGEEAAENFAGTLAAMQALYCKAPAPTLGRLLDKWLAKIGDSAEKIPLIERMMEAFTLVATGRVVARPDTALVYIVGLDAAPTYVDLDPQGRPLASCACGQEDGYCSHTLAAQIYHRMHREEV